MLLSWTLWAGLADAACPASYNAADLVSALDDAKEAYGDLEVEAFREAMQGVHEKLPCLDEEVNPHLSAELHRFEGLLGFLDRDLERSQRAFASARAIEPNYKFPVTLVPEGHPVLEQYATLDPGAASKVRLAEPLQGRLLLDGTPGLMRPTELPMVFQWLDGEGSLMVTEYLWAGDALPSYPVGSGGRQGPLEVQPVPKPDKRDLVVRAGPNRKLLVGAGVTALVSGLCYGSAAVIDERYYDVRTDVNKLDSLRRVNNGFVVASGATLLAAAGLGTGAFLTGQF